MSATVGDLFRFELGKRDLARRFAWAMLGLGLIRSKGIVTLPLALWILGPADYGRVTVVFATASIVASLVLLNVPDGAGRLVVSAPSPGLATARLARIRRTSAIVAGTLAAGGGAVGVATGSELAVWAAAVAAAAVLFKGASVHLEYFQRTSRLVRLQVLSEYGAAAAGLILALWLGVAGLLAASAAAVTLVALRAWRTISTDGAAEEARRTFWAPALRLSLPLLPVSLAQWALFSLDSLLIYRLLDASATGAYSVAYSIASVALLLPFGLTAVWFPTAQRLLARSPSELGRYAVSIGRLLLVGGILLLAAAVAARPLLDRLLESGSYDAVPACVPWIAGGFAALALAKLAEGVVYALGRPGPILGAYAAGAVANLALNLLWIPRFGIVGAAYATAAGYALTAALLVALAARGLRRTSRQ